MNVPCDKVGGVPVLVFPLVLVLVIPLGSGNPSEGKQHILLRRLVDAPQLIKFHGPHNIHYWTLERGFFILAPAQFIKICLFNK